MLQKSVHVYRIGRNHRGHEPGRDGCRKADFSGAGYTGCGTNWEDSGCEPEATEPDKSGWVQVSSGSNQIEERKSTCTHIGSSHPLMYRKGKSRNHMARPRPGIYELPDRKRRHVVTQNNSTHTHTSQLD